MLGKKRKLATKTNLQRIALCKNVRVGQRTSPIVMLIQNLSVRRLTTGLNGEGGGGGVRMSVVG